MAKKRLPAQIRASIEQQIRQTALNDGRPIDTVRRRFVYERFLDRVFHGDPEGWILKGGVGMMVRVPNARHSLDIDLVGLQGRDSVQALIDLTQSDTDPFRYVIDPKRETDSVEGTKLTVIAYLGGRKFETFRIDLVSHRSLVGEVERRPFPSVVEDRHGDFEKNAGAIQLFPLTDQIADKLCAMHETHGDGHPSSRPRDLVDLLLICEQLQLELHGIVASLASEQARREISLPGNIAPPQAWSQSWSQDVNVVRHLPRELHSFEQAITKAAHCFDRALVHVRDGTASSKATWSPRLQKWEDSAVEEDD